MNNNDNYLVSIKELALLAFAAALLIAAPTKHVIEQQAQPVNVILPADQAAEPKTNRA